MCSRDLIHETARRCGLPLADCDDVTQEVCRPRIGRCGGQPRSCYPLFEMRPRLLWPLLLIAAIAAGLFVAGGIGPASDADAGTVPADDAGGAAAEHPRAQPRGAVREQERRTAASEGEGEAAAQPAANALVGGRVLDERAKTGIEDALVSVTEATMRPQALRRSEAQAEFSTRTDRLGAFRLRARHDPDGMRWVAARREGFFTTVRMLDKQQFVPAGTGWEAVPFDLALVPLSDSAGLRGRVLDDTGKVPVGARLEVEAGLSVRPELGVSHEYVASIDGRGRFALAGIPPGRARLTFDCAGFQKLERDLALAARSQVDLGLLRLRRAEPAGESIEPASLAGTVLDADGARVAGARVVLGPGARGARMARVAEDGHYLIDRVVPGPQRVLIEAPRRPVFVFSHVFQPGEAVIHHHRFANWKHFLGGVVVDVDERDEGIEGIAVSYSAAHTPPAGESGLRFAGRLRWETRTGADGGFRLDGLPPEPVDVSLSWSEGAYRDIVVRGLAVDRHDHVLRFPKPRDVRITGVVRDADGAPIADAQVSPSYGRLERQPSARARTGADGRYLVRVPLTNQQAIRIHVQRTGFVPAQRGFRLVAADRERTVRWDVTLYRESDLATLSGRVRDHRGAPVEGAKCHVWYTERGREGQAVSDELGRFEAKGLLPGRVELRIDHVAHRRFTRRLELSGSGRHTVDATLERLQQSDLAILLAHGPSPVGGQEITVYCEHPNRHETRRTAADGTVRFPSWPRVPTRVWVREGERQLSQAGLFDLARTGTGTLRIAVRRGTAVIHGVVVTPAGNPLPAELVACHEEEGPGLRIHSEIPTGRDGRFRFENLPEGTYLVDIAGDARHRREVRANGPAVKLVFLR